MTNSEMTLVFLALFIGVVFGLAIGSSLEAEHHYKKVSELQTKIMGCVDSEFYCEVNKK